MEGNLGFKIDWASLLWEGNFYHFCFVLLCIREQIPCTSPPGGLYSEGRFNGGFFALRFWGAYIWRGLFSEFYSMLTLWSSQIPLRRMIGYFFFLLCEGQHSSLQWTKTFLHVVFYFFRGRGAFTYQTSSFERWLCRRRPPSKMVILMRSFPLAGDSGIFCKNWQNISLCIGGINL